MCISGSKRAAMFEIGLTYHAARATPRSTITAAHIGPGGPDDPPGVNVFYIDSNFVTSSFQGHTVTMVNDPEFLGDSGIPSDAGHYAFHPAAGVAGEVQVAFRAAR
jgi:hypothetical protein